MSEMKAIQVKVFGEPDVMEFVEQEVPVPGTGELLVRVQAAGVNPVETYIRAGTYPLLPDLPYTPGGNVAGIIEKCGEGSGPWQEGDQVYSAATLSGAYAELALCSMDQLFRLPKNISFSQGAAIGVPAATAWRALFIRGEAKPGDRVFIHGGSGSVGQAAIQLARANGLRVYASAGSEKGCKLVEKFGAVALNHNENGYDQKLLKETDGQGVDLIVEMLANKNLEKDLNLLAPGGRVVIVGSRGRIDIDPRLTMGKETDIRGLAVFNASRQETVMTHAALFAAMENNSYIPTVSVEMVLADAAKAHHLVMQDNNCGKIVLIP